MNASSAQPQGSGIGQWVALALGVAAVIALFLLFPFDLVQPPAWLPQFQRAGRDSFAQAAPALMVSALAVIIALAEITSTFPNYPREALLTRWAWVLVLVNLISALIALWVAWQYSPNATNPLLLALSVGLGFPALIRTKFILAKPIGADGQGQDVSVNLGWLYDQFQNLCKTQIDLDLMNGRRSAVTKLLRRYSTVQDLHNIAAYTIDARDTLSDDDQKQRSDSLNKLVSEQAPTEFARAKIALFILETGGRAYVNYLLDSLEEAPAAAPPWASPASSDTPAPVIGQPSPTDVVVRQLGEKYKLEELVNLATSRLTDPALLAWVAKTAEPAAGVTEHQQKSAISYRLVRELGLEAAKELAEGG